MRLLKNAWTLFQISATMQTNSFLSLLRRLPLAGQLLPGDIYGRKGLKRLFLLGGLLKGFLSAAIGKMFLCVVLLSWIPKWFRAPAAPEEMLALYLLTECLAPAVMSCSIFQAREADYVFLNHFMMNPKEYYHYKIAKDALTGMLLPLPVLVWLLNDFRLIFVAVSATVFFILAGCLLYLFFYDKLHGMIRKSVRRTVGFGIIAAAYVCQRFGVFRSLKFRLPLCAALSAAMLLLSVLFYLRLLKYQDYKRIAVEFANKDSVMLVVSVNTTATEGESALTDTNWEENKAYFEKNGGLDMASYLNQTFFLRFKKVFSDQRRQIFLLSIPLGLLFGYLIRNGVLSITEETILNYTPILITFVTSSMLFGERFTALCFHYVDMPLLYHRICEKEYLKKSIRKRYAFLVRHSLVALLGIALFALLVLGISGIRISVLDFVFLLAAMEFYMLVNEIYKLLLYYWIQPYTVDISVKSPVFRVLGAVEGLLDISVLFVRGNLALACVPLAGLFVVVNILLLVVRERADRTFRLRY